MVYCEPASGKTHFVSEQVVNIDRQVVDLIWLRVCFFFFVFVLFGFCFLSYTEYISQCCVFTINDHYCVLHADSFQQGSCGSRLGSPNSR